MEDHPPEVEYMLFAQLLTAQRDNEVAGIRGAMLEQFSERVVHSSP